MVTLADLQVTRLGECTVPSPLASYVGGRATNQYYVGEDDRILFDDTVELVRARGLPLDELSMVEAVKDRGPCGADCAPTMLEVEWWRDAKETT